MKKKHIESCKLRNLKMGIIAVFYLFCANIAAQTKEIKWIQCPGLCKGSGIAVMSGGNEIATCWTCGGTGQIPADAKTSQPVDVPGYGPINGNTEYVYEHPSNKNLVFYRFEWVDKSLLPANIKIISAGNNQSNTAPNTANKKPCVHTFPCNHRVPCTHTTACSHKTACSHLVPCTHWIATPYGPRPQHQADFVHPFDLMHVFDYLHPFDVAHTHDFLHQHD